MADEHLIETPVARRVVHEGRFITFRIDTIDGPDGTRHTREVVAHPGAVAVLALDGDELLLVRQFRHAVGAVVLEIPAGTLDREADGSLEDPALAAPRELAEETGHAARSWRHLGRFWTAPGFTDERMHLYLATDLQRAGGDARPDEGEWLDLVRLPVAEAIRRAEDDELHDAKTLVGVLRLARLIDTGEIRLP